MSPYIASFFPHAAEIPLGLLLAGIIWSLALGFAAGNYACSLVHRLPRGLGILEKKPYCGSCQTMLATKDLFPVVSALLLRHKCRYCSAPIPKSHFYTEILIGLLFCSCFTVWGFSEQYLIVALLGSMLTVLASIHSNESSVDGRVLLSVLLTGMLFRTLQDDSIYGFFSGGIAGLMLGSLLFHKHIQKRGHIFVPPLPAMLLTVGGVCVGLNGMLLFLPYFAALTLVFKTYKTLIPITVPFGLAVVMSVLIGG